MAERFYGLDRGENGTGQVTEGAASTATTDVEVRIDLAAFSGAGGRSEVLILLDVIKQAILEDTWPPA